MQTVQEKFWKESFGDDYIDRNKSASLLSANIAFFSRILERVGPVSSIIECGANVGMNMKALHTLHPNCKLSGVEINSAAIEHLKFLSYVDAYENSILEFNTDKKWDLTFTKGVLIHINPNKLPLVYDLLYNISNRYILVAEYYNPSPVTIPYRGHDDKLFKRDFAGEMLDRFTDLKLVDYRFCYHRDPVFPQDDISWFLLEKKS